VQGLLSDTGYKFRIQLESRPADKDELSWPGPATANWTRTPPAAFPVRNTLSVTERPPQSTSTSATTSPVKPLCTVYVLDGRVLVVNRTETTIALQLVSNFNIPLHTGLILVCTTGHSYCVY